MKYARGMTVLEVLVVGAMIAIVIGAGVHALAALDKARMVKCGEELWTMEALVEQTWEGSRPYTPTWEEIQSIAGNRWGTHYHYIPNNSDLNKGHGNDLDMCDEENPGKSMTKRTCLELKWVIVCDHDHSKAGGKYNFVASFDRVYAVPTEEGDALRAFLRNMNWWDGKDPHLQRWIGR